MGRFNIRVYGLWIADRKILVCKENVGSMELLKFPGGGMEFGEGTIECLKREWMEELNTDIEIISHFYTTDYFQPSAFDKSQIISIYYNIRPTSAFSMPAFNGRESFYFREIDEQFVSEITLPIDKIVAGMIFDINR